MTHAVALGLFAKWPDAGRVKTRLARETSPEFAATIARTFLFDTLERLRELAGCDQFVAYDPPDAQLKFAELVEGRTPPILLEAQSAGDLGTRLETFCQRRFDDGYAAAILIGSDSPNLPANILHDAIRLLQDNDAVVGPTSDGGYYLIGLRRMLPIFAGIAWSSDCVFSQTIDRLIAAKARYALLPLWYDVDTLADLRFLEIHLKAMRNSTGDYPTCEALLAQLSAISPKPNGE